MKLWSHQEEALRFAMKREAPMLAMEMGTGKTAVALQWLRRSDTQRVLVVAPYGVVKGEVWEDQAAQWWPTMEVVPLLGSSRQRVKVIERLRLQRRWIAVINYHALGIKQLQAALMRLDLDAVVFDESHRLKKPGGSWSMFARRLCWVGKGTSRQPRQRLRLMLTGTPMPHDPLDIYAQFRALNPAAFNYMNFAQFRNRYAEMGGFQNKVPFFPQHLRDALEAKLQGHVFRVRSADVLDLPEEQHIDVKFDLTGKAKTAYKQMEELMVAQVEAGVVTAANGMTKLLRLQQLTGGWAAVDDGDTLVNVGGDKLSAFADLMEDLAEPVVVFGRFRAELDDIREWTETHGWATYRLDGSMNEYLDWRGDTEQRRVLVVQIQAGGEGLDFSQARVGIYYSTGYDLGMYLQSEGRIHPRRVGAANPTVYYHLLARGTVDVACARALRTRENVVGSILEHLKGHHAQPATA